jgi:hypothetical protein
LLEQRRLLSGTLLSSAAAPVSAPTTGRIYGYEINDQNHRFIVPKNPYGNGGLGIKGVTVFIDANSNGTFDAPTDSTPGEVSVLTNEFGVFTFDHLAPGSYRICQTAPEGFQLFSPAALKPVVIAGKKVNADSFQNTDYSIVKGTKGADQIEISSDPSGLIATINGKSPTVLTSSTGIFVQCGSGNDRLTIDAISCVQSKSMAAEVTIRSMAAGEMIAS